MDRHTPGLKRKITDEVLRTSEAQWLRELASECDVEPADPTICDACAAYLVLSETTDLEDQFQTGFNEGRPPEARPSITGNPSLSQPTYTRPWLFVPGDRVIVLIGAKMEGGTVQKVQMPGPVREDHTVYVSLDQVDAGTLFQGGWFDPDQVEILAR